MSPFTAAGPALLQYPRLRQGDPAQRRAASRLQDIAAPGAADEAVCVQQLLPLLGRGRAGVHPRRRSRIRRYPLERRRGSRRQLCGHRVRPHHSAGVAGQPRDAQHRRRLLDRARLHLYRHQHRAARGSKIRPPRHRATPNVGCSQGAPGKRRRQPCTQRQPQLDSCRYRAGKPVLAPGRKTPRRL
jgi:hypothetical protein